MTSINPSFSYKTHDRDYWVPIPQDEVYLSLFLRVSERFPEELLCKFEYINSLLPEPFSRTWEISASHDNPYDFFRKRNVVYHKSYRFNNCILDIARIAGINLKAICLKNNLFITDLAILAIAEFCPNIEELDLTCCKKVSDIGLYALSSRCHKIKHLKLGTVIPKRTFFGDFGAQALIKRNSIESADLSLIEVTAITLQEVATPTLESIYLSGCFNSYSPSNTVYYSDFFYFTEHSPNLRSLKLNDISSFLTDEMIGDLSRHCSLLEELDLSQNIITDDSLRALSANNHRLQQINLDGCFNVTFDEGVELLATRCHSLVFLSLQMYMVLPKDFIHYQNHSKATKKAIDNLKKCSNNLIEFKITDINKQTHRNDFFSKI